MAKQQKFKVKVDRGLDPRVKSVMGQDIIDFIVTRTRERFIDKKNRKFPGYTKGYKKSIDFRVGGKSSSEIDLTLSGNMLDSMKVLDSNTPGEITIGYSESSPENGKVEGNVLGTYGQKSPIRGKKRDFLGIAQVDLKKIKSKFPVDDEKKRGINVLLGELAQSFGRQVAGNIKRDEKVFQKALGLVSTRRFEIELEEELQ